MAIVSIASVTVVRGVRSAEEDVRTEGWGWSDKYNYNISQTQKQPKSVITQKKKSKCLFCHAITCHFVILSYIMYSVNCLFILLPVHIPHC